MLLTAPKSELHSSKRHRFQNYHRMSGQQDVTAFISYSISPRHGCIVRKEMAQCKTMNSSFFYFDLWLMLCMDDRVIFI